jgi:hypothetical protein
MYSSFILDLDSIYRRVDSFTTRPPCPRGKSPQYPLDRRLGRTQGRSGRYGKEKNLVPLPGIETRNLVDIPTALPRFHRT